MGGEDILTKFVALRSSCAQYKQNKQEISKLEDFNISWNKRRFCWFYSNFVLGMVNIGASIIRAKTSSSLMTTFVALSPV